MKYREFSQDLRRKFLLIGLIPTLVVSAFLFGKIYFMLEDISESSHKKVLKDIEFYIGEFKSKISKETLFLEENFKNIDLNKFIKSNVEVETMTIFKRDDSRVLNIVSDYNITENLKREYLKNNPFSIYKDINKPTFKTIHKSINGKDKTISYVIPTKDYIFVFDINIKSLKTYIDYVKSSINYIILIVDYKGNYILKTSDEPYFKDNFFKTEYYKKVVSKYKPFEYVEFFNEEQDVDNFMSYYKSKDKGWLLVTIEDFDSLDDEVIALMPFVILLMLIIIIVIIILAKQFTQKIVTPLEILIDKMEKLSNMSSVQKIEIDDLEYSLFKRIIDSFNIMQDKIFKREQELKKSNELLRNKTEEITILNVGLKERIEEEIEKNRRKDQQMLQQSRLAQMGEMISMIAHQWRQPLAAISSASMALNIKAKLNKVDQKTVLGLTTKILDYSQHLSSTIDDFREFFKANKEKKETTFSELLKSVLNIIEASLINKNIKLIQNLEGEQVIYTYPNELKQVILNLIKNVEDVLLEREVENPKIIITVKDSTLSIEDNAGGVPENIIDKIFDPYFSTKTKKDGTGLGLYMSKTIIEEHCGGRLLVKNSDKGAIFTIVL